MISPGDDGSNEEGEPPNTTSTGLEYIYLYAEIQTSQGIVNELRPRKIPAKRQALLAMTSPHCKAYQDIKLFQTAPVSHQVNS